MSSHQQGLRVLRLVAAIGTLGSFLAPAAHADILGSICADGLWMKLSHDSATGQEMVCGGAYPDPHLTWKATGKPPATLFANLPVAGAAGSPCNRVEGFRQSSDGYVVECRSGRVFLPGQREIATNTPVWGLYEP